MSVNPTVEAPTRKMLGQVLRGELDEFGSLVESIGSQMYESAVALCIQASGYIAVSAANGWPTDADITTMARHAATTKRSQVTEQEISDYISRVVLKNESPLTVFDGSSKAAVIPVFSTAVLLVSFHGRYDDQWQYLDAIWNAINAAENVDDAVVPAVIYAHGISR